MQLPIAPVSIVYRPIDRAELPLPGRWLTTGTETIIQWKIHGYSDRRRSRQGPIVVRFVGQSLHFPSSHFRRLWKAVWKSVAARPIGDRRQSSAILHHCRGDRYIRVKYRDRYQYAWESVTGVAWVTMRMIGKLPIRPNRSTPLARPDRCRRDR